jgi:hypothetical protein
MFKLSIQGRHFLAGVAGFLVVLVLATPLRGGQKDKRTSNQGGDD